MRPVLVARAVVSSLAAPVAGQDAAKLLKADGKAALATCKPKGQEASNPVGLPSR